LGGGSGDFLVTLTEFLLARFDEDNETALGHYGTGHPEDIDEFWLAECDAKRRIVEMHTKTGTSWLNADGKLAGPDEDRIVYCELCSFHEQYEGFNDYEEPWPCPTLRILALPYADHPDYQPEWRV
jgi:hypothetical protein